MPALTNMPTKTKYTPGDVVYCFINSKITQLTISSWKAVVTNPLNDSAGVQTNYYYFTTHDFPIPEQEVYASKNHLLWGISGKSMYINQAIMSGSGGSDFVVRQGRPTGGPAVSLGSWTDFAGFDLSSANFRNVSDDEAEVDIDCVEDQMVFDGARLSFAQLPSVWSTKSAFKASVKSYDKLTTLWTDNNPIGE